VFLVIAAIMELQADTRQDRPRVAFFESVPLLGSPLTRFCPTTSRNHQPAALVARAMDPLASLFVAINLALVVAFYAERRGLFDVEDEDSRLRELRPIRIPTEARRQRGPSIVP